MEQQRIKTKYNRIHRSEAEIVELLATMVSEKYVDQIPLYRQMNHFERAGIKLAHSTLSDWIGRSCILLEELYQALRAEVLGGHYLQMDETTIRVLDKSKKGKTHRGYFWVAHTPPQSLVFFEYQAGRNQEVPQALLRDFSGYLQTDGYEAYASLESRQELTLLCCMGHARRYFEQALNNDNKRASHAMEVFGKLYAIERDHQHSSTEERQAARQQEAKPLWEQFGKWLEDNVGQLSQNSAIYTAFAYTMRRFKRLSRYMEDGNCI